MKQTIGLNDFRNAFKMHERKNFSYEGLEVLFDWLEAYEEGTDTELELDVIALCCEFSEDDYKYIAGQYNIELSGNQDIDFETVKVYLEENTQLCGETSDYCLVYQQF